MGPIIAVMKRNRLAVLVFIVAMAVSVGLLLRRNPEEPRNVNPVEPNPALAGFSPANSIITISGLGKLDRALRQGQRISIVSFSTDAASKIDTDEDRPRGEAGSGSATRFAAANGRIDSARPNVVLRIRGTFSAAANVQDGFPDLGHVSQDVPVVVDRGGDATYRRLRVLLRGRSGHPLRLLAVSVGRSTSILNADLSGPLEELDIDLIRKMAVSAQVSVEAGPVVQAEGFLGSRNPWLNWLGLSRLAEARALKARHFRQLIEARPTNDTERLAHEMFYGSSISPTQMKSELPEVEALIQLPGKQMAVLRELTTFITMNPDSAKNEFDMRKLHDWLVEYDKAVVARGGAREVSDAVQKLLRVLPE